MAKFSQYRAFVAIADSGSIRGAAKELNLTSSAVSKQVSALEDRLKVQLFDRSNRSLKLTRDGREFYHRCGQILQSVAEAEEELQATHGDLSGSLALTLSKSLIRTRVFDVLARFGDRYPQIMLKIDTGEDIQNLQESNIDFAFRLGELEDSIRNVAIAIDQVDLIFCAAPSYLEAHGAPEKISSLSDHRLIFPHARLFSLVIKRFLRSYEIVLENLSGHVVDDSEAVLRFTKLGMGIGLFVDGSVNFERESGQLVKLFSKMVMPSKTLHIVYKKQDHMSTKNRIFKEFIQREFSH